MIIIYERSFSTITGIKWDTIKEIILMVIFYIISRIAIAVFFGTIKVINTRCNFIEFTSIDKHSICMLKRKVFHVVALKAYGSIKKTREKKKKKKIWKAFI